MPDATERKRRERQEKTARGMVRFEKWVFPEVREPLHKEADRLNAKAEKERK